MRNNSIIQSTKIGHNINMGAHSNVEIGNIIISSLSSNDLSICIKKFFYAITHRDWKKANILLTTLNNLNSLDCECKNLLRILQYKLHLSQKENAKIDLNLFIELLRSEEANRVIKDAVESIYLHHLSLSSIIDTKKRYENSEYRGSFCTEVFYETLANEKDLSQALETRNNLFEHELCSLVRCAIRNEHFEIAVTLSEDLNYRFPNRNSTILCALSKSYMLNKIIDSKHIWIIDSKLMKELKEQIELSLKLIENCDDPRIIHIATILLAITKFQEPDLIDICKNNIQEAEKIIPKISILLTNNENSSITAKEILKKEELNINKEDSYQILSAMMDGSITSRELQQWLNKGGDIIEQDNAIKEFIKIFLQAIVCEPKNTQKIIKLSQKIEDFLTNYFSELNRFNIQAIHKLCEILMTLNLPTFVISLIKPFLPNSPWCSPILEVYAQALLDADQLSLLDELLEKMEGINENYRFMSIQIEKVILSENIPKATQLLEIALTKFKYSCYYWKLQLYLSNLAKRPHKELKFTISKIPKDILKKYSIEGLRLLYLIAKTDIHLAESFILEWFIDNPTEMAINVTNFHINNIEHYKNTLDIAYPSERCAIAVKYSLGKDIFQKLIVDDCSTNEYLLDSNSPLGKLLKNANVGDTLELGMVSYKVIEKLPPIVAAFQISLKIRNDINPGTDCFYQFPIEDNSVEGMLKQIDPIYNHKKLCDPEINGQVIPILMRLNKTHKYDLVKGSLLYLCDKNSNLSFNLYSGGKTIKDAVILDVLSLSYLSLTGFCHGLIRNGIKIYITRETKEIVSKWLKQTGSPDYFSITKSQNHFVKITADDIAKDTTFNNLNSLFRMCDLIHPEIGNMPEEIIKIRDNIDISHYSSIRASISHSIPLLCLDIEFCSLYNQLDILLANAAQFINDCKLSTLTEKSKHVECHIQYGLNVPISYEDLVQLCGKEEKGQYLATQLLKMYPNNYPSTNTALYVLTRCCLLAICNAYINEQTDYKLDFSEWRYTQHIVYACSQSAMLSLQGNTSEQRLARLISQVINKLRIVNGARKLALILFSQFAHGHFLDVKQIEIELKELLTIENCTE
ncbi:hypothetical protein EGB40_03100 [Pasteurella multocida]|uniref:GapS6b family protein n=1 Tax=Pasteurella multocida TaxID=747 RepID=UPI00102D3F38|nr:hypothetical protein [Pasteurella multocida]MCZ0723910.1 hypothetical protein [Pasteurella multocida]NAT88337.1 hypothetical protein [Pasteurella multocida]QCA36265.1 hypothetical protein E5135_09270 [Pasteurella multocida]QCA37235.1 hypothetical protein E5136_03275 [Pasteurella multocida]UWZ95238.1 hypothetical protein A0R66_010485 [Pasteurella multocida subsp. multocida]